MGSNNWSRNEEELLKENYGKLGAEKCSILLGRTKRACQIRAKKLLLKYVDDRYNKINLLEIVKDSKTKSECLRRLNLSTNVANKNIILYGDWNHSLNTDNNHININFVIEEPEYIYNLNKKSSIRVVLYMKTLVSWFINFFKFIYNFK